jgi:hypothetical protein
VRTAKATVFKGPPERREGEAPVDSSRMTGARRWHLGLLEKNRSVCRPRGALTLFSLDDPPMNPWAILCCPRGTKGNSISPKSDIARMGSLF